MEKNRLEAFSDGVIAVIITVLVLELKVPHSDRIEALLPIVPTFLSYVLSFVYVGIYWNNHHHMLQASARISCRSHTYLARGVLLPPQGEARARGTPLVSATRSRPATFS